MKIEDLGYGDFFESNRKKLKLDTFSVARVIAEYKGAYKVKNTESEYLAKITGKQMFEASSREDYPAVGDWVAIKEIDAETAVIKAILPRRTIVKRKDTNKDSIQIIATNIDVAFVIESVDRDYNLNRFERYFAIAKDENITPVIIINKIDLICEEGLASKVSQIKDRFSDVTIFLTSTINNKGTEELMSYVSRGKTYCFLGSSGVGKTSLVNTLLGEDILKTKTISFSTGKGVHTTTKREMYFLKNGSIVIDNPGMREVGMTDSGDSVDMLFDEVTTLAEKCKFTDCTHTQEPGCKVLEAVRLGEIDEDRFSNYINLKKESEYYEMNEIEKKEKKRQFGKFVKKVKDDLRNHKHKDY